jgi:[ribosomal protein S5]-alanine N-acetyltransferase
VLTRAVTEHDLTEVSAKTTLDNLGSHVVLERVGFVVTGEITLNERSGLTYRRDLGTG